MPRFRNADIHERMDKNDSMNHSPRRRLGGYHLSLAVLAVGCLMLTMAFPSAGIIHAVLFAGDKMPVNPPRTVLEAPKFPPAQDKVLQGWLGRREARLACDGEARAGGSRVEAPASVTNLHCQSTRQVSARSAQLLAGLGNDQLRASGPWLARGVDR